MANPARQTGTDCRAVPTPQIQEEKKRNCLLTRADRISLEFFSRARGAEKIPQLLDIPPFSLLLARIYSQESEIGMSESLRLHFDSVCSFGLS